MYLQNFTETKTGKYAVILLQSAGILQSFLPWLVYFAVFRVLFIDLLLLLIPCLIAFGITVALLIVPSLREVKENFFIEVAYAMLVSSLVIAGGEIWLSALEGIQYIGYFPITATVGLIVSISAVIVTHKAVKRQKEK